MAIAKLQAGNFAVMKECCLDLTIKKIRTSNRFNYRAVFIQQGIERLILNQMDRRRSRIVGPTPKLFSNVNGEDVVVRVPVPVEDGGENQLEEEQPEINEALIEVEP